MQEETDNEGYLWDNTVLRKETTPMTLTELFPFAPAEVPFPSLLFNYPLQILYDAFFTNNFFFKFCEEQRENLFCRCSVQSFRWLLLMLAKCFQM